MTFITDTAIPPATLYKIAVYLRYSSDKQNDRSIEDQLELCKRYAASIGAEIVEIYVDRAISGSSKHTRPEFKRMLTDAETGKYQIVLCESIDRLGRNLEDLSHFHNIIDLQ